MLVVTRLQKTGASGRAGKLASGIHFIEFSELERRFSVALYSRNQYFIISHHYTPILVNLFVLVTPALVLKGSNSFSIVSFSQLIATCSNNEAMNIPSALYNVKCKICFYGSLVYKQELCSPLHLPCFPWVLRGPSAGNTWICLFCFKELSVIQEHPTQH